MTRYVYSTMLYLSLPPLKAIEKLIDLGVSIELSYDNFIAFGGKLVEDKYIDEIINSIQRANNYVKVIHIPYDEMSPSIALSDIGFKRFIKWLDFAHKLGVDIAVVHTLRIDQSYEKAIDLNIEFLKILAREARDRGVDIAIENRLEKNLFGSKPRDLLKIINSIEEKINICLDIGHANINKNLAEFLSTLGRNIIVMHAHDNDGHRDQHKPPYSGTVEWTLIENWITKTKFDGIIVFEIVCKDSVHVCNSIVDQIKSMPIANI